MVGTDPAGKGGIASVVTVWINEGFLQKQKIVYVCSHVSDSTLSKTIAILRALTQVIRRCVLDRPTIVHVHSSSHASFIRKSVILAVARAFGCKTIFHLHSGGFHQFATVESGPLMRLWIRHTLRRSTRVFALSESWADFLAKIAPGAVIEVLPNVVPVYPRASNSLQEAGRILFLGLIDKNKGIFELLHAIARMKVLFPEIKLAIGGEGAVDAVRALARELKIEKHIECLGWIGPEQKRQELARASIFALPSYAEGLPMAMLEAMAAEKAVIATPVGGIPGVIEDGFNGLLVPAQDVHALTAALEKLMSDSELHDRIAIHARKTIEARFSADIILTKLNELYNDLSEGRQTCGRLMDGDAEGKIG